MQLQLTRSRLASDPADLVIAPRLGSFGLLDYHRGSEAIEAGRSAVYSAQPLLRQVLAG
jgi:NTE family protein